MSAPEKEPEGKEQRFLAFEEDLSVVDVPTELAVLPLRGVVIFPSAIVPLLISRGSSLKAVEEALAGDRMLGVAAQKNPEEEEPDVHGLYSRGTAGRILKMLKYPDNSVRILVQGLRRIEMMEYIQNKPFLRARVRHLTEVLEPSKDIEAMQAHMVNQFAKFVSMIPYLPDELQVVVMNIKDPGKVSDLIASNLNISMEEKQDLLSTLDVKLRLEKLSAILNREIELVELGHKIQSQVQTELSKNQKEFYLRQQMRAIQKELGEGDARGGDVEELRKKMEAAQLPAEARKAAEAELERLRIIPPESAEHTVVRTYLEWLVSLPWAVSTEDNLDIPHARQVLDEDHYDLEKIKDRILEYLAVRQLKKDPKGPILCFVGPPGTGKTSLGRSIARAMGRKFIRLSLGGIRDEAEIRGHRRTYIGSLPGRIIQNIRNAGSHNPLFMLDEIDKLGADFRGDPASALLEVLDPEQNNTFLDHYLDVPFDLSRVMFITTANLLDPIPPPLRDRMEVIELAGYTEEEKLEIARRHLIPKQRHENGLEDGQITFATDGLIHLIRHYTREAGLRNLEREIGTLCRKVARGITEGKTEPVTIDPGQGTRIPRCGTLFLRDRRAHARAGRSDWTGVDADGRGHHLHRVDQDGRQEGLDAHRPSRRGDEGVGAGGAQLHPLARRTARDHARLLREPRSAHPRARRRGAQGRSLCRRHHRHLARLAAHRAGGAARRRHDRRDHVARQGAGRGWDQGEGAGGAARRHHHHHPAQTQREGP